MKKGLAILICVLSLFFLPYIIWQFGDEKELQVVILDKTVPTESVREHSGLVWLLNHYHYQQNKKSYDAASDYYGFYQNETEHNYEIRTIPSSLGDTDLIYMADTYGVYEDDLPWTDDSRGERSTLIYGGLENEEWQTIKQHVTTQPSTLVAEFNTFASPTTEAVRNDITDFLHLEWTGWTGRYFDELSRDNEELPLWMIERHEAFTGESWTYDGGGFVLVHDWNEEIVVLSEELNHISEDQIRLAFTKSGQELFGLKTSPSYRYWFDIVIPYDDSDVLAYYDWDLSEEGQELLQAYQIPEQFAAVLYHQKNESNLFYFAGDFVDIETIPMFTQIAGWAKWKALTTFESIQPDKNFFWKTYVPMMQEILQIEKENEDTSLENYPKTGEASYSARIENSTFEVYENGKWTPITIKGVNMGMAKPGFFPGEAAIKESEYYRWFEQIGEVNANTIRVYTLHPPEFYRALKRYNEEHEESIYLFHGAWFNEESLEEIKKQDNKADAYTPEIVEEFETEWKNIVDAIHGQVVIEDQTGHASGSYYTDVSPYVIGWIIGIEWYPYMVDEMRQTYSNQPDYQGVFIDSNNADGMEQWLAWQMDELLSYEKDNYGWMRPMSFTNWVTTDLLEHPAEPNEQEDLATVNPNLISLKGEAEAVGMFASYHIYPYYPDFLNLEENYTEFIDHRGLPNNYAGYLKELHEAHDLPILVAEFGVPSSRGLTHRNPFGWNQGFLSEAEQGDILKHLFEDILVEGILGGLAFTWQDEWFKRTWNTMEYDNPSRRPNWSNAQTNEQHFGLLSFDRLKIKVDGEPTDWSTKPFYTNRNEAIEQIFVDSDERYLYLRMDFGEDYSDWSEQYQPMILFDIHPEQGNQQFDQISSFEVDHAGIDFILDIQSKEQANLLVDHYYDSFYFDYGVNLQMLNETIDRPMKDSSRFNPIRLALNKEMTRPDTNETLPFEFYETGILQYGNANPSSPEYDSLADYFYSEENRILELRIPWLLLNVKDPSQREIIGDLYQEGSEQSLGQRLNRSEFIDGINIGAILLDENEQVISSYPKMENSIMNGQNLRTYTWNKWNMPMYEERLKQSYFILQEYFKHID